MKRMNRLFVGVLALAAVGIAAAAAMAPVDAQVATSLMAQMLPASDYGSVANALMGMAAMGSIKQLNALKAARGTAMTEMQALLAAAEGRADGMMTDAERQQFDELEAKIKGFDGDINRVQTALDSQRAGSSVKVADTTDVQVTDNVANDPKGGFKTFGDYACAVRQAAVSAANGYQTQDQRILVLNAGPTNMASEGSGDSLGILIPAEFSQAIFTASTDELDNLLPLDRQHPSGWQWNDLP